VNAECYFCGQLNNLGQLPAEEVVWEFPHSVAFLGAWQFYRGYCLLASRQHARELWELDSGIRQAFFEEMTCLAQAIHTALAPHKLNYELLGNQTPHLHRHIFPRYEDDPARLEPVWLTIEAARNDLGRRQKLEGIRAERPEIAGRLRATLEKRLGMR
jgi:diadenosine tetraphosphate (Ap4A) HIT family hydrolase